MNSTPSSNSAGAVDLSGLGWHDGWAAAWKALDTAALVPGRIVGEDRHVYSVVTAAEEVSATLAGRLLHETEESSALPRVGDWVALTPQPGESKGVIRHCLPRRTRLARRLPGRETREQVLAANVDLVFIVQSLDANFRPRRLERFLMMAHDGGVAPVVVLNKADLCSAVEARVAEARAVCGEAPILVTSIPRRRGLQAMARTIRPAQTVAFIGSSGVGKSSLINSLYGEEIQATIEVRAADAKGRHTTSWRELIPLPGGGLVMDTPGLRELQAWLDEEGLAGTFPEIRMLAGSCRFRDCRHAAEPGCAVRAAATSGVLPRDRYEAFLKLQGEHQTLAGSRAERQRIPRPSPGRGRAIRRQNFEDEDL
ncbi:MAG: ribosome small subunit-dependent GTPase A [Verrucomicrobia bacterium]|nr:ribosome small subunit-dependent GTPase A [Verrucomicrobiota bacterium]